jgi:hypothetical protein
VRVEKPGWTGRKKTYRVKADIRTPRQGAVCLQGEYVPPLKAKANTLSGGTALYRIEVGKPTNGNTLSGGISVHKNNRRLLSKKRTPRQGVLFCTELKWVSS